MHTVIADECTGCDLCVEPCPVDCIDMLAVEPAVSDWHWKKPDPSSALLSAQIIATDRSASNEAVSSNTNTNKDIGSDHEDDDEGRAA
jgi:electron transport complex protein RnfB